MSVAHPASNQAAGFPIRQALSGPALRYLAALLLLTPLLGGIRLLATREVAAAEPEVVTQVVEVPQTVYVEVPVVKVVVVRESSGSAGPTDEFAVLSPPEPTTAPEPDRAPEPSEEVAESAPPDEGAAAEASEVVAPPVIVARASAPRPYAYIPPAPAAAVEEPEEVAEVPAEPAEPVEAAPEEQPVAASAEVALSDPRTRPDVEAFYARTDQLWSVEGYSSAEEMRQALGNSQTGWLKDADKQGALPDTQAAMPDTQAPMPDTPDAVADQPPSTPSDPLEAFYAQTEQAWSAAGYSSAEEMREVLGNSQTGWLKKLRSQAAAAPAPEPSVEIQASEPAPEPSGELASEPASEPTGELASEPEPEPAPEPVAES